MPNSVTAGADVRLGGKDEHVSFFAKPSSEDDKTVFDFSLINRAFLDGLSKPGESAAGHQDRCLLPAGYQWVDTAMGKPRIRIPVALCEFAAYKAALAYADEKVIEKNLGDAANFKYFDSSKSEIAIADTQGFAFQYDGMVFIIMRGSESKGGDWRINFDDAFTDKLQNANARLIKRLKKRHGDRVESVVERIQARRGRHLGFAIAWAAVHDEITAYLDSYRKENSSRPDIPIVIAGHSLGGALALIGASELKRQEYNIAAVVTFGAPLVGNEEFKAEYDGQLKLKNCTVQFEAAGDSVPRLMRRWYYRLNRNIRDRVIPFVVQAPSAPKANSFLMAGNPWGFAAQPPLSLGEVDGAIRSILNAAKERAAKEEQERKEKERQEKERKEKDSGEKRQTGVGPGDAALASTAAGEPRPQQPAADKTTEGASAGSKDNVVVWIVVGIAVAILLLVLWLFVRSKLASHAVMDRYALYLSTLSYQHIRSLLADDSQPVADRLARASADLDHYMDFIRGRGATYFKAGKEKVDDRPVRLLKPNLDLKTFLSDGKNIV